MFGAPIHHRHVTSQPSSTHLFVLLSFFHTLLTPGLFTSARDKSNGEALGESAAVCVLELLTSWDDTAVEFVASADRPEALGR